MKWAAVIVAAGRGTRLGHPKQLLELAGLPMVGWSIRVFAAMPEVAELIVATEPDSIVPVRELLAKLAPQESSRVVGGGATRQQSVHEGLGFVTQACDAVLVHDGARPLVIEDDVRAGMAAVGSGRASLLATPVVDTIKQVNAESLRVGATLDRRTLWSAQTPQFALTADLRCAHERARREGFESTDDAALLERIGIEVVVVRSKSENFKVTHQQDVARAVAILQARELASNVS
ncbi:MAG: 2-C-methyl-D-erythritol 4-phosphate cytidylyltransferase [Candidatus Eremiobacteraeota bacterium]|nr:2-C-methyl-D-erythritol 4-phosphate cytidylyltransferase [Candidatus Eremiobacteraeota bacterium]